MPDPPHASRTGHRGPAFRPAAVRLADRRDPEWSDGRYMPRMLALYEETPAIENGMLVLPETPGLGLKFDEKALAAFKVG